MAIISALPNNLTNGTTADASQVMADFNQIVNNVNSNAAENGANSSITSLSGLLTPLSVGQGGTGSGTAAGARSNLGAASSGANTDITSLLSSASAMALISSATINNSAAIDFTSIQTTKFVSYKIVCDAIVPAVNSAILQLQVYNGGVLDTGVVSYSCENFRFTNAGSGVDGSSSTSSINLSGSVETLGNAANQVYVCSADIFIGNRAHVNYQGEGLMASGSYIHSIGGGKYLNGSSVDGFRVKAHNGNLASGTIRLYGILG